MSITEVHHVLKSTTTQRVIVEGRLLHHTDGTHWKLEAIHAERHVLTVTRGTPAGRVRRNFAPEAFQCELTVDTELYVDKTRMETLTKFLIVQTILLTLGAFIAWELPHLIGA